jgi:predicted ribosomally synthesized peptide with nif11-like leader
MHRHQTARPARDPAHGSTGIDIMSEAEIARFHNDVERDQHLREQVKHRTLADIVTFAAERGYSFNVDEADAYTKANGPMELSEAQLDAVAGGRQAPCFAAGTRIMTPGGEVPVEDLLVGDLIVTAAGEAKAIVFIGHRRVDCRRHSRPELVRPVRVAPGAFGRGRPSRVLYLSPDHAVFVTSDAGVAHDGVLIPVKHLIDGETIRQVACDSVMYFHVELERHDVLLSEGLPTESYLDAGDRDRFDNVGAEALSAVAKVAEVRGSLLAA